MAEQPNGIELDDFDDGATAGPHAPLVSGKVAVLMVLLVGVLGAASGWLYIYDQKRVPQEFWGFESPKIFADAETVTAVLLKPEAPGVAEKKPFYDELYMVDANRYVVVKKVDISKRDDLSPVRQALSDHRNFDSSKKLWKDPEWRFGLIFVYADEKFGSTFTASIVFDSECRLGRPQSVEKTISTAPMSASLLAFFEGVFPEAKEMPKATPPEQYVNPIAAETPPAQNPNGLVLPRDVEVLTLPNVKPSGAANPAPGGEGSRPLPTVVPTFSLPPAFQGATRPQVLTPPGSSPGGMNFPGPIGPPSSPYPAGPSIDLSTPRSVVVPPLDQKAPGGLPNGSGT